MFDINPTVKPVYEFIGEHKTPIIIIDDFAKSTESLIEFASSKDEFKPDGHTGYPGIRMPLPRDYVISALKPLINGLYTIYNIPRQLTPSPKSNYFSLISKGAEHLTALQKFPHFDTPDPNLIAFVHYLGEGEHGGTGFFKDRKNNISIITESEKQAFYQRSQEYAEQSPSLSYCDENNPHYACYHRVEYKPNRLIAFPGQLLHSTLVNIEKDIDTSAITGRLTANMFVEFK